MTPPWTKPPPPVAIDRSLPAVRDDVLRSIEGLTGDDDAAAHHTPTTLVQADEVVRFGVLAFAFDDPATALASNRRPGGFRPEVYRLYLACARARLDFLNRYTLSEPAPAAPPGPPSNGVFVALVYLHNLWVLCTDDHAGLQGLYRDKSILGFYEPLYAFPDALHAAQASFHLDDLITVHAAVLRFLAIYGTRLLPPQEAARFEDPLRCYAAMRSHHPVLLLLLDQLIALSPLSRLWFLPHAPLHVDAGWAGVDRWATGCQALFSRAARPLLMILADYLIFTIFRPTTREADEDDWKSRYRMQPRPDALAAFNQFLEHSQARYGVHPAYVDFRLLCSYYFYQSGLLPAAENYCRSPHGRADEAVLAFLEHSRWIGRPEQTAPPAPGDLLATTLHHMRIRLQEAAFDGQCRLLLEQWE
jgi:hypothetical protein